MLRPLNCRRRSTSTSSQPFVALPTVREPEAKLGSETLEQATVNAACAATRLGAATGGHRLKRIGIQLYTLRDAARADLDRTLADIAATGYSDVEMLMSMRNFNHSPKDVRAMLD